jgi:AraC-like DNA-binding protein
MTIETLSHEIAIGDCKKLAALVARHTESKGDGVYATAIAPLELMRQSNPSTAIRGVTNPTLGIVVQGRKEVLVNEKTYQYGVAQYLIVSVDLPLCSCAIEATPEQPYLGFKLDLDLVQLCEIIAQTSSDLGKKENSVRGWSVSHADATLIDCAIRLTQLLDTPQDMPFLAPLIIREIYYRLLSGEQGEAVRQIASSGSNMQRIAEAVNILKTDFAKPLRIDDIAEQVNMSAASFHRHFKEVTSMSPLQYQKQIRLLTARQMMLTEGADATRTAYQVGYESPSQFSREYSRMFGAPPIKDIERLRVA